MLVGWSSRLLPLIPADISPRVGGRQEFEFVPALPFDDLFPLTMGSEGPPCGYNPLKDEALRRWVTDTLISSGEWSWTPKVPPIRIVRVGGVALETSWDDMTVRFCVDFVQTSVNGWMPCDYTVDVPLSFAFHDYQSA